MTDKCQCGNYPDEILDKQGEWTFVTKCCEKSVYCRSASYLETMSLWNKRMKEPTDD